MRLPPAADLDRPWRIHEVLPDFRLEDVWAVPGDGGPGDFPVLVDTIAAMDPAHAGWVVRTLFAARWQLGRWFGWDDAERGIGRRVPTLRDRLPADLREAPAGPTFAALPFTSLYLLEDEWAAEIANETMHGVMHIGAVPAGDGRFRAQMAVYVKPNGMFGNLYMAAIKPFRYLLVYPPLLRAGERAWRDRSGAPAIP